MGNSKLCKSIGTSMIFIIIALGLIYISSRFGSKAYFALSFYIAAMLLYMIIKKVISFSYEVKDYDLYTYSVSVVTVVEDQNLKPLVTTIKSLLNQEYPLKEIIIINSNSKNLNIYNMVKRIRKQVELFQESGIKGGIDLGDIKSCPDIIIKRLVEEERRIAEVWGFTRSTGDIILTCEPNSIINKEGIKELIKPFEDSSVSAVTGNVKIDNKECCKFLKILSKIREENNHQNLKIQSKLGNVFFCDSSLSCYRREVILNNIKNYVEDRSREKSKIKSKLLLTDYSINLGKTVYIEEARCSINVKDSFKSEISKDISINRGFLVDRLKSLKNINYKINISICTLLESIVTSTFLACLVFLINYNFYQLFLFLLIYYLGSIALSININGISNFFDNKKDFLLNPIYSIFYYITVIPIRIYAFFTIKEY